MDPITATKLRFPAVAERLGVSLGTARHLARTDPLFPSVIDLGPRSRLVLEDDLRAYIAARTISPFRVIA
jgi:predicted DNA-binding transcriptional regulator AlpA